MIKAIIFDVGGVLIRTRDWSLRHMWEDKLGLAPGETDELVFGRPMGLRAQLGEITTRQLWKWIGQQMDLSDSDLSSFRRDFWAEDELDTKLIGLIRRLRSNYQTAIISNAMDDLRPMLMDKYSIANDFDLIVCSAEEGVMKPDVEIFRRAQERLGRKPQETIFVDDNKNNVFAARELGFHTIQFAPEVNLNQLLSDLGVQTDGDS